jgi:hypothetical protein
MHGGSQADIAGQWEESWLMDLASGKESGAGTVVIELGGETRVGQGAEKEWKEWTACEA